MGLRVAGVDGHQLRQARAVHARGAQDVLRRGAKEAKARAGARWREQAGAVQADALPSVRTYACNAARVRVKRISSSSTSAGSGADSLRCTAWSMR